MPPGETSIQTIIDTIVSGIARHPLSHTVDVVKTGDPGRAVTGIVTTFLATTATIRTATALGANLIVTHEPTFYNHEDRVDWLEHDPVYRAKRALLDDHGIVVFRLHDYIHLNERTDGIVAGLLQALDWQGYADPDHPFLCSIPPMTLLSLIETLKERLGLTTVRVAGDPAMTCRRVGLLVGSSGVHTHVRALRDLDADVVVCGEINEWETAEYVRDAVDLGHAKALVVVGHANSEEAGMVWFTTWLRHQLPDIPITHIPAGDPLLTL
ncbi:MAG: hypothetical protein NVS2B16_16470 [Chloroflexota bacterium]